MHPIVAPAIPWASGVVPSPVVAEAEGNDAEPQLRSEFYDWNTAALIIGVQVVAVNPAAIAFPVDIAPGPIIQTTVEIQQRVGRNGGDQRIVGTRPGPKVHCPLRVGIGSPNRRSVSDGDQAREQ